MTDVGEVPDAIRASVDGPCGTIAVVIPCLDAAGHLARTVDALTAAGLSANVLVVDGGSADGTPALAAAMGARVISAPRGRGNQLAVGGREVVADWLLFLHADTVVSPTCGDEARRFAADPANRWRAAWFRLRFDDPGRAARLIAGGADRRARRLGLPYGDQGLLISREFHDALGGYRPIPLMEDVDMVRRIGRRRLVGLESAVTTSFGRYRRDGCLIRPLRNLLCLTLYLIGVPPRLIARIYGR